MKKIVSFILVMMLVLCGMAVAEEKPTLVMGTNAEFPPYEYYDGDTIVGMTLRSPPRSAKSSATSW